MPRRADGLPTLDPPSFDAFRKKAHEMLDGIVDHVEHLADGPAWRPMPADVRSAFDAPVPFGETPIEDVHAEFERLILPYGSGNAHPRFVGWVQGGGTPYGMMAELLAAGLNPNVGGRDHAAIEVERQIVRWMRRLFGFPESATGILVTGTSMANLLAVIVAKTKRLGAATRERGLAAEGMRLIAYTSTAAHGCVRRAMEHSGLGSANLRMIPTDAGHRMNLDALTAAIAKDRAEGHTPFLVVGNAGTVDIGAIDHLDALATCAKQNDLWFHVDGAFGSLGVFSPELAPKLAGLERADSIALDFHKWGQVPYDAGFLLVRDGEAHRAAFADEPAYLARDERGLSAGQPWFTDFGPDLSRGFRALKVWFTLKTFGVDRLGATMAETCRLAQVLEARVASEPTLELLAPVPLNIVCFRVRHGDPELADRLNRDIVVELQESGVAVPSTTRIDGKLAIRVAIVNHRCREPDLQALVDAIVAKAP
ncbi:Aromatic-L-amino-acid decarboxylase [Labilithrix luteola]|uniref:Aromatic-L-amino-acid decarboxylase n=1 Tax=Labilithrix luteola TaxID=1391654 RepID=A0A0K1QAL1_9BACT|nr:pyridoxal-dependent decarboxylase [Labilithrix luteola]AKV02460.1 Aromatic-L-amino-acid decarboxylase [Labilithrix luteola]